MGIRTVIVDDEPPSRSRVRRMLERDADIEVIVNAERGDGQTAVAVIKEQRPDLVLLDVRMPEMDGFDVVEQVGIDRMPVTIFVTAHDRYAIRAFEAHALDYLLKPFGKGRFDEALDRAKEQLAGKLNREALRTIVAMLGRAPAEHPYFERLPITDAGRTTFVDTEQVDWIEANGNSVRLHAGPRCYELRETLTSLGQKLNPRDFVRITARHS